MQYIFQILILFILISTLLKLSFWKPWQTVLFGLLCAVFIIGTCRWAVLQSKTQLADFLGNTKIMQDAAVLITIEAALCFAFCFAELQAMFGVKKERGWKPLLNRYPGLLVFPVLFYLQTQLIFGMPGTGFALLSYLLAAVVFLALPLLSFLLKYLCPERELRLEVYFLVNLFVCITGLITTVNGNTTYSAAKEPVNINAILLSSGLFILFFILGILGNKYKWTFKNNKSKNGNHL
ncbi:MAG: hypothetical protein LBS46_02020 [Dysgonamonadaceae bacterium]|jgi:hypothetical protein|nr:hypothetical protein [Dysgonamonadaceae bacterium]